MMTTGNYTHNVVFDGKDYSAYRNDQLSKVRQCEGCWINTLGEQITDNATIDKLEAAVPGARAEYDRQQQHSRQNGVVAKQQRLAYQHDRRRNPRGANNRKGETL